MRFASTILLASTLTLAGACGGDDDGGDDGNTVDAGGFDGGGGGVDAAAAEFSLELTLMGYGMAHNGDTLYFSLRNNADDAEVASHEHAVVSGGGGGGGGGGGDNTITLSTVLAEGGNYTLYWYADVNANSTCDMDTDHHWSMSIPSVSADVMLEHQHTLDFNGDCTMQ